jgi:hypothetical protein
MPQVSIPAALRVKIGDDAAEGLLDMFAVAQAQSEVQLTHEISALRVEMHQGFAQIRQEVSSSRVELLKWMIGLWVANLSATIGILAFVLRHS